VGVNIVPYGDKFVLVLAGSVERGLVHGADPGVNAPSISSASNVARRAHGRATFWGRDRTQAGASQCVPVGSDCFVRVRIGFRTQEIVQPRVGRLSEFPGQFLLGDGGK
jgi:hypothetical protein